MEVVNDELIQQSLTCSLCTESFDTSFALQQHLESSHNETYACNVCFCAFATYEECETHLKEVHGQQSMQLDPNETLANASNNEQQNILITSQNLGIDINALPSSAVETSINPETGDIIYTIDVSDIKLEALEAAGVSIGADGNLTSYNQLNDDPLSGSNYLTIAEDTTTNPNPNNNNYHQQQNLYYGSNMVGDNMNNSALSLLGGEYHPSYFMDSYASGYNGMGGGPSSILHMPRKSTRRPRSTYNDLEDLAERRYLCELCQKRFKKISHLKDHIRSHTGEKPFECTYVNCGLSFSTKGSLKRHIMIHTQMERPFACPHCYKTFRKANVCEVHIKRSHYNASGEFIPSDEEQPYGKSRILKPFKCPQPFCNVRLSRKSTLKRHILLHAGKLPYVCDRCGKSFKTWNVKKRHYESGCRDDEATILALATPSRYSTNPSVVGNYPQNSSMLDENSHLNSIQNSDGFAIESIVLDEGTVEGGYNVKNVLATTENMIGSEMSTHNELIHQSENLDQKFVGSSETLINKYDSVCSNLNQSSNIGRVDSPSVLNVASVMANLAAYTSSAESIVQPTKPILSSNQSFIPSKNESNTDLQISGFGSHDKKKHPKKASTQNNNDELRSSEEEDLYYSDGIESEEESFTTDDEYNDFGKENEIDMINHSKQKTLHNTANISPQSSYYGDSHYNDEGIGDNLHFMRNRHRNIVQQDVCKLPYWLGDRIIFTALMGFFSPSINISQLLLSYEKNMEAYNKKIKNESQNMDLAKATNLLVPKNATLKLYKIPCIHENFVRIQDRLNVTQPYWRLDLKTLNVIIPGQPETYEEPPKPQTKRGKPLKWSMEDKKPATLPHQKVVLTHKGQRIRRLPTKLSNNFVLNDNNLPIVDVNDDVDHMDNKMPVKTEYYNTSNFIVKDNEISTTTYNSEHVNKISGKMIKNSLADVIDPITNAILSDSIYHYGIKDYDSATNFAHDTLHSNSLVPNPNNPDMNNSNDAMINSLGGVGGATGLPLKSRRGRKRGQASTAIYLAALAKLEAAERGEPVSPPRGAGVFGASRGRGSGYRGRPANIYEEIGITDPEVIRTLQEDGARWTRMISEYEQQNPELIDLVANANNLPPELITNAVNAGSEILNVVHANNGMDSTTMLTTNTGELIYYDNQNNALILPTDDSIANPQIGQETTAYTTVTDENGMLIQKELTSEEQAMLLSASNNITVNACENLQESTTNIINIPQASESAEFTNVNVHHTNADNLVESGGYMILNTTENNNITDNNNMDKNNTQNHYLVDGNGIETGVIDTNAEYLDGNNSIGFGSGRGLRNVPSYILCHLCGIRFGRKQRDVFARHLLEVHNESIANIPQS